MRLPPLIDLVVTLIGRATGPGWWRRWRRPSSVTEATGSSQAILNGTYGCGAVAGGSLATVSHNNVAPTTESCSIAVAFTTDGAGQPHAAGTFEAVATYKKIMAAPPEAAYGTVTKEGVRAAERAWLRYRDAWVAFTKLKFPAVDPLATKTWLTNQRAAMISEFLPQ